jgi:hypothetical protein
MEMKKEVWITLAEVEAHDINWAELERGEKAFVNVLVIAESRGDAESRLRGEFHHLGFHVVPHVA